MIKHNHCLPERIRKENSDFNQNWISQNQFLGFSDVKTKDLDVSLAQKKDASPFNVVWLKNIDRLIDLLPFDFSYQQYSMIDVGCGSGISSLYFASKYRFKSYYGFDFSTKLIEIALKNLNIFLKNKSNDTEIKFEVCDAINFKFQEKSVLFMFNPFGRETIKTLILNNLEHLKQSKSIILYANDHHIDLLLEYGMLLNRDAIYNLSCIQF